MTYENKERLLLKLHWSLLHAYKRPPILQYESGLIREHVIKSTCDENVNQLTLGVGGGGGSNALQHYHRTK